MYGRDSRDRQRRPLPDSWLDRERIVHHLFSFAIGDYMVDTTDPIASSVAASSQSEAGAPDLPEDALSEAAHLLRLAGARDVSLEDYRDSVGVLFSALERHGWRVILSEPDTLAAGIEATAGYRGSIPLVELVERCRRLRT